MAMPSKFRVGAIVRAVDHGGDHDRFPRRFEGRILKFCAKFEHERGVETRKLEAWPLLIRMDRYLWATIRTLTNEIDLADDVQGLADFGSFCRMTATFPAKVKGQHRGDRQRHQKTFAPGLDRRLAFPHAPEGQILAGPLAQGQQATQSRLRVEIIHLVRLSAFVA